MFGTALNLAGLTLAGVALAACSGTTAEPTTPPQSASPAVVKDARYGSVTELKDAAVIAGLLCPKFKTSNKLTYAAQSGECGDDSVLATYATDVDLQDQLIGYREFAQLFIEQGVETNSLLIGPNWTINSPQAQQLQPVLGGVVDDPQSQ